MVGLDLSNRLTKQDFNPGCDATMAKACRKKFPEKDVVYIMIGENIDLETWKVFYWNSRGKQIT